MTDPELLTDGARPAIRVERRYGHPIERVRRAVITPEHSPNGSRRRPDSSGS